MNRLLPMSRSIHKATSLSGFFQDPPRLPSKFDGDPFFQSVLKRYVPAKVYDEIKGDLSRFGTRCSGDLKELGDNAEANHPRVEHFDTWGRRVDKLITSEGWRKLHDVAAEEGLVSIAYERKYKEHSRVYMFAKNYLFTGTTAVYGCPLAMTDGAARLIEIYGDDAMKAGPYKKLISRDPKEFWTSGQWMTERPGGSDVGNTETIAMKGSDGQWNISGFKWFSSATDADMTMLLARVVDEQGKFTEGSKGLSLFLARIKDDHTHSKLNGVRIHRLKNKLGTKALPTAELELDDMKAVMVGAEGRGVASIATILNITRIHNAISSCGAMRTAMMLVQDFALKRRAFGKLIHEHPLHVQTLASMELNTRTATELTFFTVHLLGKSECGTATPSDLALLRMLTPLVKLYTAKQSVWVLSEAMEAMGGQGYIEDTGLARIYRDTQVGTIWEGTTNVLSLDLLRVLKGSPESLKAFEGAIASRVDRARETAAKEFEQELGEIKSTMEALRTYLTTSFQKGLKESGARDLAYTMTRVFVAALMLDIAVQSKDPVDKLVVKRWCEAGLVSRSTVFPTYQEVSGDDYALAIGKSKAKL